MPYDKVKKRNYNTYRTIPFMIKKKNPIAILHVSVHRLAIRNIRVKENIL